MGSALLRSYWKVTKWLLSSGSGTRVCLALYIATSAFLWGSFNGHKTSRVQMRKKRGRQKQEKMFFSCTMLVSLYLGYSQSEFLMPCHAG